MEQRRRFMGWGVLRKGILSVLFWSIIAAAFIGPGTVATAAGAGALFGLDLIWALAFSILATGILQEAAARITLASGKNLGEIIALTFQGSKQQTIPLLLFAAVAFGCAAYQAGNLLGALAGISFFSSLPRVLFTFSLSLMAAILLWIGHFRSIANTLAILVACMGIAFVYVAFKADTLQADALLPGFIPRIPDGAGLIVLGLVGTTIVPYNLFLASGLSRDQSLAEMRIGIWLAVLIGGLISMAILIVGSTVTGTFDFPALAIALAEKTGPWAIAFFGLGLFAAGFTSSITAPLAAAVTGSSLIGKDRGSWSVKGRYFRLTWAAVLGVGTLFGVMDFQPIPVIILAQAINGLLLPFVAVFMFLAVNNRDVIPAAYANSGFTNVLMLAIVGVACFLGLLNVWKAMQRIWPAADAGNYALPFIGLFVVLLIGMLSKSLITSK